MKRTDETVSISAEMVGASRMMLMPADRKRADALMSELAEIASRRISGQGAPLVDEFAASIDAMDD